jgi:hypothetical protein
VEWGGGSIYCAVGEADGRGAAGNSVGVRRPTAARGRKGARPEVGDGPDRWAPPVGGREREEVGEREAGGSGPAWAETGMGRGSWAGW